MMRMMIPDDKEVLMLVGAVALRHGHMDHILRLMVKTLEGLTISEALDATEDENFSDICRLVKRLTKMKLGTSNAQLRVNALVQRALRASRKRNELLHSLWAADMDNAPFIRTDNAAGFKAIPTVAELKDLADRMEQVTGELNFARLEGFLHEALIAQSKKLADKE